jgi:membrane fusion protein (multidrug efflux system)
MNTNQNNHDLPEEAATNNAGTRDNLTTTEAPTDLRHGGSSSGEDDAKNSGRADTGAVPKRNHRMFAAVAAIIVAVAAGIYYFEFVAPFETTDDAFVEAHVPSVAPQISGGSHSFLLRITRK